jgi:ABC-type long-subunit fatty acid transport system fused permease/ATPase subunit
MIFYTYSESFKSFSGNFFEKTGFFFLTLNQVFPSFFNCNTYYHTMSHDDEHPLVVALAWSLSGVMFAVYILVKIGAIDAMTSDDHVSERLELYDQADYSLDNQEAD